jgi:hypothetical protein
MIAQRCPLCTKDHRGHVTSGQELLNFFEGHVLRSNVQVLTAVQSEAAHCIRRLTEVKPLHVKDY